MLRPIKEKDRESYTVLQKEVWVVKNALDEDIEEKNWKEVIESDQHTYAIVDEQDNFIGYCYGKHMERDIPELAIEILQCLQGQGIGRTSLLELMERLYRDSGKKIFEARVFPDNYPCLGLMKGCRAVPAGLELHPSLVGEDVEAFRKKNYKLIDSDLQKVAEAFQVSDVELLGSVLIFHLPVHHDNEKDAFNLAIRRDYQKALEKALISWELQEYKNAMEEIQELLEQELTEQYKQKHQELIDKLQRKADYIKNA